MLTNRQKEVLALVRRLSSMRGPTIRQLLPPLGISSPNGVVCHLIALQKKGYLQHLGGRVGAWIPTPTAPEEADVIRTLWGDIE